MSTSSPQSPQSQGALEEASSPKSRVRITVLTILALHVVVIGGLLLQGCDKRSGTTSGPTNSVGSLPSLTETTNTYYSAFPGEGASNSAAASHASTAAGSLPGAAAGTGIPAPGVGGDVGSAAASPSGAAGAGSYASSAVPPQLPSGLGSTSGGAPVGSTGGGLAPLPSTTSAHGSAPAATGQGGSPVEHVIKKGDTIGALARKYKVTEKAIADANPQVKARSLRIDDKLMIPPPAPAPAPAAAAGAGAGTGAGSGATATDGVAGTAAAGAGEVYVVKPWDTLAKIAKKFGVSVKALRGANNLKSDRIVPKQRLTIPIKAVPTTTAPQP